MPNSYTRTLVDHGCYVIDSKTGWNFGEPQVGHVVDIRVCCEQFGAVVEAHANGK